MEPLGFCHLIALIPGLVHRSTPPTLLTWPRQLPPPPWPFQPLPITPRLPKPGTPSAWHGRYTTVPE